MLPRAAQRGTATTPERRNRPPRDRTETGTISSLKPSPLPKRVEPMLCTLIDEPFDDPNWIFEPKFDGQRVLCRFDGKKLELFSRRGFGEAARFPEIAAALKDSLTRPALVDGEIVCLDEQGHSSFRRLQQRFHLQDAREIAQRARQFPAHFYAFDLLYTDRYDLMPLPLRDRKELLREAIEWSDRIRWTESTPEKSGELFQAACRAGQEGILGKRVDSRYVPGRSRDWVKIKCLGRQEFVICGFTEPEGARTGLGALLVGYYEPDGQTLAYAGKVGTGFTHEILHDLRDRLEKLEQPRSPEIKGTPPRRSGVHWVKPKLVAEIAFAEWTEAGMLRQPRFEGLREDKEAREVRREMAKDAEAAVHPRSPAKIPPARRRVTSSGKSLSEYQRKRDFTKTAEPPPKPAQSHREPIFVVQEHHARRLHWDFRLEADGVLKSWAVTKEPTLDPKIRRLAVRTEDHPLEYATFHGDIPAGQYGAGHVDIWDNGTYRNLSHLPLSQSLDRGKAEVELHGTKLKGKFALVRMAGDEQHENWLMLKMKEEAVPSLADKRSDPKHPKAALKRETAIAPAKSPAVSSGFPFEFAHVDKVMFPEKEYTKADVLRYYAAVAGLLLPHLRDRPITLERLPEGVRPDAPRFWQKRTPSYYPSWIPRLQDGDVNYALVNDANALLYMVNQGALTFHTWMSRVENLDHPDFVVFDLDPGGRSFADLVKVAKALHRELESARRDSFLKTSGKTGLHVVVPWSERGGYDEARAWALSLAERVVAQLPELTTTERRKAARQGRSYLDVMQNARARHVVPPYVLRAVPGATISTPLDWDELSSRLTPARFDLKSALKRFERQNRDLMAALAELPPAKAER